jgi:hypothetical protein
VILPLTKLFLSLVVLTAVFMHPLLLWAALGAGVAAAVALGHSLLSDSGPRAPRDE